MYEKRFATNLCQYFKRICFNFHLVQHNVYMRGIHYASLCHSMRCFCEISKKIDKHLSENGKELEFISVRNLKEIKRNSVSDSTFFIETKTSVGVLSNFGFSFRALTDEEMENARIVRPIYYSKKQTFDNWLGSVVAQYKKNGKKYTISRLEIIKRISNRFGGSHPYEVQYYEKDDKKRNKRIVNNFIDSLMIAKTDDTYHGYLIIKELAYEMIKAFLPLYENIKETDYIIKAISEEIENCM